jgi:4-hydroxythreonine-4-phosphate dehydrogenase
VTPFRLALSIGDPAGIGPEIAGRVAQEVAAGRKAARLLLVGDRGALERDAPRSAAPFPVVADPDRWDDARDPVAVWEPGGPLARLPPHGVVSAEAGAASFRWVREGALLARAGRVDGLVTGPIHKGAWEAAGAGHPGHTEALREVDGARRVLMLMTGGRLRVALATVHVALGRVPGLLDAGRLEEDLVLLSRETARWFGPPEPRIAVAGLNPHAGEGGLFGTEDRDVVAPAVRAARARGVRAEGPFPADACIPAAWKGAFDVVLAMYHDQGLVAVKTVAPRRCVNVTLGLSFVRTSVDHGTAFDVAGRGVATPTSLIAAIDVATEMVLRGRTPSTGLVPPPT